MVKEFVGCLREVLEQQGNEWRGRKVYPVPERTPEEQRVYNMAGNTMNFLSSLDPSFSCTCTWAPNFELRMKGSTVARISSDAAVEWVASTLKNETGLSVEEARRQQAEFRRS